MHLSPDINPLEVSCRTLPPNGAIDWHTHWHDEFCLVLGGAPTVGHAGAKLIPQTDTLFLFNQSEVHGIWSSARATARIWSVEFHISSTVKTHFRELFEQSPERRVIKLSPVQRQRFCHACQRLALEKGATGLLNAFAASAWLTLELVNVTRWLLATPEVGSVDGSDQIDPQCFELWQKIHRQVLQPNSSGPMLFGLNPCHDSLRHRFRKIFGVSPQAMWLRLRMDRAKDLLRTGHLSVKEIAHELGYTRQHDLSRAFHKYTGTSPSEWKMRATGLDQSFSPARLKKGRSPKKRALQGETGLTETKSKSLNREVETPLLTRFCAVD